MAEWKTQLSYNYIPPYHHAYGLMYQQHQAVSGSGSGSGSEPVQTQHQQHQHLSGWTVEHRYYATTTPRPREDLAAAAAVVVEDQEDTGDSSSSSSSSPASPEGDREQRGGHYTHNQGVVDTQIDRLYPQDQDQGRHFHFTTLNVSDTQPANLHNRPLLHDQRCATPTSDWDAHTSPDSWSSASSREEGLPQADPASWVKNEDAGSPDDSGIVSSSVLEETQTYEAKPDATTAPRTPRTRNLRTTFSEEQMRVLVQRFNAQWYLSPGEMKIVAVETGLTYRQVKTWFQNRRMKLRKRQKDAHSNPAAYHNAATLLQQYQGEARTPLHEQYSQHTTEAGDSYKNLAYYLAVVGAAGSTGYPRPWSPRGPLAATPLPSRHPGLGWPLGPVPTNQYPQQQQQQQPYDYASSYSAADTPVSNADANTVSSADSAVRGDGADDGPMYTALV